VEGRRQESEFRSQEPEARSKNLAVGAGPCARLDERLTCRVCRGEKSFALLDAREIDGSFPDRVLFL